MIMDIFDEIRTLIPEIKNNCFIPFGIRLPQDNYVDIKSNIVSENSLNNLSIFIIKQEKIAFYNKVNNFDDINKIYKELYDKLEQFSVDIADFRDNNGFKQEIKDKLSTFKIEVDKSLNPLVSKHKKLVDSCKKCNDINSIRENVVQSYRDFLEKKIFKAIVFPLYDGYRNDDDSLYVWLITKINKILKDLGIYTLKITIGERIEINNDVDVPYCFTEPKEDNSDLSNEIAKKQTVKNVLRYAYVFNDDNENYSIVTDGLLELWRFE